MKAVWVIGTAGIVLAGRLCSLGHRPQRGPPGTELVPLHPEWNHFIQPRAVPEIVADLVVRYTEPCRRVEAPEATHRVRASFDPAVILLDPVV